MGDLVVDELRFLGHSSGSDLASADISLVYNGVPAARITLQQKQRSRGLMQQYSANLFGNQVGSRPDYVFTHVTRMVQSKALWRDIRVLEHLDRMLAKDGKTAVLFVVSTANPIGQLPSDVYRVGAGIWLAGGAPGRRRRPA